MSKFLRHTRDSTVLRLFAGFALSALALAFLGWLARSDDFRPLDRSALELANGLRSPLIGSALRAITHLGSTLVLFGLGSVVVVIFLSLRWWRAVVLMLLAMAGQAILHHGFKAIVARSRPERFYDYFIQDGSFSFPSGHAIASMTFYGTLAWLVSNRIESPAAKVMIFSSAAIIILLIGISRIYFNVHHASDVLAGFAAGLIWIYSVASSDRIDKGP